MPYQPHSTTKEYVQGYLTLSSNMQRTGKGLYMQSTSSTQETLPNFTLQKDTSPSISTATLQKTSGSASYQNSKQERYKSW